MSTAEEGGATANTTSSSYGGGGAGGKFRKKPFRRQATPYDRPPTAPRGNNLNNDSNSSWLTKLVVEPASKLFSYGADRFFASVLRRRLPPPPPPQPPEGNADVSDRDQVEAVGVQDGEQEPGGGHCEQPINSSSSSVLELEQLLKQKTFTRSEIVHLTELLQSRAVESSLEDASQKNEETTSDFGRRQESASHLLQGNRNVGIRSSAALSTPARYSKVLEDDIASPAKVAKAYMGSRPSKVSPSDLGVRRQLGREDAGPLTTMPFASKSPIMSLTNKTSVSLGAPENGFITPRSRSRSAIYNMARTPYSRVHPTSILKGSGINDNGYARRSTSSPLRLMENNEKFESQPVTLKRRSSVLDDEGGSVSPIRKIRQKSNLLGPRFHQSAHGLGIGSHSKQDSELSIGQRNNTLKNIVKNENLSVPCTSYAHVPSRSLEVASRILQHLEKTPKEKSSESKLVVAREKSSLKLSPGLLSGQSFRSMEDAGSSKLLLDVHDDCMLGNGNAAVQPDAHDSSPQRQGQTEESEPKRIGSVSNHDSAVSLKAPTPGTGTFDFAVKNGASQPPQKKRAFRMSAQEDSLEEDDLQCNGVASRSPSEERGPTLSPLMDGNLAPPEEHKLVKNTFEAKDLNSRIRAGDNMVVPGTSISAVPLTEETKTTLQSEAFASSVVASDKPKEANNPPLFSLSSKVAECPSVPFESIRKAEPEIGRSSSLDGISVSIGSQVKAPEPKKGSNLDLPKPGDINGKYDNVSSPASNGSLFSSSFPVSFLSASPRDSNQISTGSAALFTSSTSIINLTSSGTSASSGESCGLATKPSGLAGFVPKFGSSADPLTASLPAGSTTKIEINPSSGSSNSSASSGSSIFGLAASFTNSTGNDLQGSFFANAGKSLASDAGTVSQGSSTQLFSSTSALAFNVNTSAPVPAFGFSSPVSSSGPTSLAPVGGTTPSLFNMGVSSTTASSTPSVSRGIFALGLSSSSSSTTTTVGSSSVSAPSTFNVVGNSSTPPSLTSIGTSFTTGTSGIVNFGASSSASSSTTNSVSSSSAPSTVFGSTWQSQKSPVFGSAFTPDPSPSTGFAFGAPASTPSANQIFSFTTSSASALSSPSLPTQPVFGNSPVGGAFGAPPVNNDQMNAEDSMAEDPTPPSAQGPVFGQPSVSPSPPGFGFGSAVPAQTSPFMFGGQQNQATPQNPSPFQATGSLQFSAGGSFSLGSGAGDKSGRKIVKINRNKNRKK